MRSLRFWSFASGIVATSTTDTDSGVAPLAGTIRLQRLMFSDEDVKKAAGELNTNLLVKKEWDAAEEWLNANIKDPE